MLNSVNNNGHKMDIRIVDFHDIFNVPRIFLESLIKEKVSSELEIGYDWYEINLVMVVETPKVGG